MPITLIIWIHLVAAIAWIGGLLFHRLVLRPAIGHVSLPGKGQEILIGILSRIEARFKTLRWLSLATLLVTGIINLLNEGGSARMESAWGAVLMLKLFFVLIVIGLTAIHDVGMAPAAAGASSEPGRASVWIGDTILGLGLVIVLIAAYLVQS
jgi:putative copper resistance protein D